MQSSKGQSLYHSALLWFIDAVTLNILDIKPSHNMSMSNPSQSESKITYIISPDIWRIWNGSKSRQGLPREGLRNHLQRQVNWLYGWLTRCSDKIQPSEVKWSIEMTRQYSAAWAISLDGDRCWGQWNMASIGTKKTKKQKKIPRITKLVHCTHY